MENVFPLQCWWGPQVAGLCTCGFPKHLQSWAEQLRAKGNVPFDVSGQHGINAHYNHSYIRHVFWNLLPSRLTHCVINKLETSRQVSKWKFCWSIFEPMRILLDFLTHINRQKYFKELYIFWRCHSESDITKTSQVAIVWYPKWNICRKMHCMYYLSRKYVPTLRKSF